MYINRLVIDANVINARRTLDAMNRLEAFHHVGVVEFCQTNVLPIEFKNAHFSQKSKATIYEIIGGPNWIGHSELSVECGRPSRFDEIYQTVFGKFWRHVGSHQQDFDTNSLRDAIHLDVCWMNRADFFLTKEKNFLKSREKLYENGFDTLVQTPEECLAHLTDYFEAAK